MGFQEIAISHLPAWVKTFGLEGIEDAETILNELELIDRLLVTQRTHMLLNRKRGLKAELEAIIGNSVGCKKTLNLNTKPR